MGNENKNEEKIDMTQKFDKIWGMYPNKLKKHYAGVEWLHMTDEERDLAVKAVPKHIEKWRKDNTEMQFIPQLNNWLNGKRWQDEFSEQKAMTLDYSRWVKVLPDGTKEYDHNGLIDYLIGHREDIDPSVALNLPFISPCAGVAKRHLEIIGLYA